MNIVITNTRGAQSYSIIRALRPEASKLWPLSGVKTVSWP